jgi:hypothetical protein
VCVAKRNTGNIHLKLMKIMIACWGRVEQGRGEKGGIFAKTMYHKCSKINQNPKLTLTLDINGNKWP